MTGWLAGELTDIFLLPLFFIIPKFDWRTIQFLPARISESVYSVIPFGD